MRAFASALVVLSQLISLFAASAEAVEVHGHRGARGARPENTLPAFQFALEAGVDVLELDLAVTSDRKLVIWHDPVITPERCKRAGGDQAAFTEPVAIATLMLDQVRQFDCGSSPNPRFPKITLVPGTRIATLDELFALVKSLPIAAAGNVGFNIETKIFPSKPELAPEPGEFARLVVDTLRKQGMVKRSIVQSFDDRTLKAVKRLEPKLRTALLTSDNHLDFVAAAKAAKADILSPDAEWILPEDVRALRRAGVKVIPWTVNDASGWDRLLKMGVDGIISDVPDELIAYLRARGKREAKPSKE